jgi:hypothetical protein
MEAQGIFIYLFLVSFCKNSLAAKSEFDLIGLLSLSDATQGAYLLFHY